MTRKVTTVVFSLVLILSLSITCAPAPAPEPAPAPTVIDQPSLSKDKVCALCWSRLPSELPEEYQRSQFSQKTREATYQGNGQWEFVVFGLAEEVGPASTEIIEKAPDHWIEQRSQEVTTYELKLTANFYEDIKVLEIADIEEFNEQVNPGVTETPIPMELRVDFINGWYRGDMYRFEGSIENLGQVPLKGIQVEIVSFDETDYLLDEQIISLEPEIIEPGLYGHFMLDVHLKGKHLRSYDYQFLSTTGEIFSPLSEDPEVWILQYKSSPTF